jgi:hypothetical protein
MNKNSWPNGLVEAQRLRAEKAEAERDRLVKGINDALQSLNEGGPGIMNLMDTIHRTHAILRQALALKEAK